MADKPETLEGVLELYKNNVCCPPHRNYKKECPNKKIACGSECFANYIREHKEELLEID